MKTEVLTKDGLNIYDELIKNYIDDAIDSNSDSNSFYYSDSIVTPTATNAVWIGGGEING